MSNEPVVPNEPVEQTNPATSILGGEPLNQPNEPTEPTEPVVTPTAPDSIDGYQVEIDNFDFDEFKSFDENKQFLERAREAGFSNDNLKFLLCEYNQLLPKIMESNAQLDNDACVTTMKETWGNETDNNFKFAQAAANNAIQNGILTHEEVNNAAFGNNPAVLKAMAYFGSQLSEDTPLSNTQQSASVDVSDLIASEAYMNESHPDHKRVYAQVQKHFEKANR